MYRKRITDVKSLFLFATCVYNNRDEALLFWFFQGFEAAIVFGSVEHSNPLQ